MRSALAPLAGALSDYAKGDLDATVFVHVEGFRPQRLAASHFFRGPSEMNEVDRVALALARGRVLDVGAGVGAHALPLIDRGLSLTALEVLPQAVEILRARGVADVRRRSVWVFKSRRPFDTVLALMNGTSLAGTLERVAPLLSRLRELVAHDGQLLMDSTAMEPPELHYQIEYRGEKGPPFPQLFLTPDRLSRLADGSGWSMEVVAREGDRYLARLTPRAAR